MFSAYVVSWVSVGLLFLWIFDADAGVVSGLWRLASTCARSEWLTSTAMAPITVALIVLWKITGYAMVVFLSGLSGVPDSMQEAAALDGAGPLRAASRTSPGRCSGRPPLFVATTSLIASFQLFDVVRLMTQGGPVRSTTVFVYAIYEQLFSRSAGGPRQRRRWSSLVCCCCSPGSSCVLFRSRRRHEPATATGPVRAAACSLWRRAALALALRVDGAHESQAARGNHRSADRAWPVHPSLGAYGEVFRTLPVARYVLNTSLMAFGIAALQIALALPAGYALAKLHFRGKRWALGLSWPRC